MLKVLRKKKTAKKIWIVLALLIIPAFVFWGLGGAIRSKKESTYLGRISGRAISAMEYQEALDAVKVNAIMRFGDNLSEIRKYLDLQAQAWERLILLEEAKRRKITASDKEVIELIESYPIFRRRGQFDNKLYGEALEYIFRIQPRAFEEQTRQNIILSRLYRQETDSLKLTEEQIRKEYEKLNGEVSVYYIAAIPLEFAKEIAPQKEGLRDYFAKNSLQFKQPLSFDVEYMSVDSEEKVKSLWAQIKKKSDPNKVVKELGGSIKETGPFSQLDPIPGIGWSPEVSNLIMKLKVGQYSQPFQIDKNYYLLRLKDRKEPYIPEFEKIKDRVKEAFIKENAEGTAKAKIEMCYNKLRESAANSPKPPDFSKAARECGLKSDVTGLFKYGSYIEGIGASDNFWNAAQDLQEGAFSRVIDTPTGFYIIRVKSKVPIDENNFFKEKEEFQQKLLALKQEEAFSRFLQDLKRRSQ